MGTMEAEATDFEANTERKKRRRIKKIKRSLNPQVCEAKSFVCNQVDFGSKEWNHSKLFCFLMNTMVYCQSFLMKTACFSNLHTKNSEKGD